MSGLVLSGYSNNTLLPTSAIPIAELAILLMRTYQFVFYALSTTRVAALQACETKPAVARILFTQIY
jgi:hypothetical protein